MKTLALGKKDNAFYKSIANALIYFGDMDFKSEHDFTKVNMLLEYVKINKIDQVLMPNPYGNNKRLTCYRKLKENNIKVIASDRGALPSSWFFDSGFNADSESYKYDKWSSELSSKQLDLVRDYISNGMSGKYLELQGERFGGNELRRKMNLKNDVKIIFVPFQRPEDTVIKYFSEPCGGIEGFLKLVVELDKRLNKNSQKYCFVLKKHPLEKEHFDITSKNIKYAQNDANIDDLIDLSDIVLLINSGVGVLSLCKQKPVICCGDSFYSGNGLAVAAKSIDDIIYAINNDYKPDVNNVYKFIHHLLVNVYSFGGQSTRVVESGNSFRTITDSIEFKSLVINGEKININKRKVLILSPVIPYPIYRGSQQRVDSVIRCLLQSDAYEVSLCVLNSSFQGKKSIEIENELKSFYKNINEVVVVKDSKFFSGKSKYKHLFLTARDRFTGQNSKISNYGSCPYNYRKRVRNLIANLQPDIVIVNYAKLYKAIPENYTGTRILDSHDYQTQFLVEDIETNKINPKVNVEKFRKSEHIALNTFNKVIAINPEEKSRFEGNILSDGIECEFIPAFAEKQWGLNNRFWYYNYDALFVGSVSNFNVTGLLWFLNEVLPIILKEQPDFKMAVAGNIARSNLIKTSDYPNVSFLGVVNDLRYVYESSKVIVAPILGGAGMKIKVVEALANGKAIIGTKKAFEGINYHEYDAAFVSDDVTQFATNTLTAISNEVIRKKLEENAKQLHMSEHSEEVIFKKLLQVIG